jgi:RNA polymerase sigma-70 factor (ECF subfamily)
VFTAARETGVNLDDRALVKAAQRGDHEAFSALVTRHQRYVYNLAYRLLQDAHEAQDLAQEAFFRAWKALETFRAESKFTTWLYRIVTNLCYNRLPGLQRQIAQGDVEAMAALALAESNSPASSVEAADQIAWLHQQVEALPAKYRLVITLFYLQEMSYQEIAETLDVPLGTVKTHLFRAREQLKQQLLKHQEDIV